MSTPQRIVGFVAVLALLFGAAFGVGKLFDDESGPAAPPDTDQYHLRLAEPLAKPGRATLRFTVEDRNGRTVTRFDVRHERRLHLIAVDTGYTGYQHLHPTMASDGTWSTPIVLAGGYLQLYADFRPAGADSAVARTDVRIPGPVGSPAFSTSRTQQVDGYSVTVLGDLRAPGTSGLRFEVARNGTPVDDLEPYLGAFGHLVMLRKADGAYLHVHPEDGRPDPAIAFAASIPSPARYHLYLDFKHAGVVRTAMFVLDASDSASGSTDDHGGEHGDH